MVTYYQILKATAVRAATGVPYARRATPREILALKENSVLVNVGEPAEIRAGENLRVLHVREAGPKRGEFRALAFTSDGRIAWFNCDELDADVPDQIEVPNLNGLRVERSDDGNTIYVPLPRELWRTIAHGCHCPHCTPDPNTPGNAYWDTLAISARGTRAGIEPNTTWLTHQPERHGVQAKRGG